MSKQCPPSVSPVALFGAIGVLTGLVTAMVAGAAPPATRPTAAIPANTRPTTADTAPSKSPTTRPLPASTAQALPSQQQIRDLYAAGNLPQCLQALTRVLALKGKAADSYDRYELLKIKGETQLRLKATVPAAQAFEEASKLAPDGPSAAQDIAAQLLLKRASAALTYQPKRRDPRDATKLQQPVSIVSVADRAKAVDLLFQDELDAITPRVKATEDAKSLPPIIALLPAMRDVRWLEMASTGSDGQTKGLVQRMLETSQRLADGALKTMETSTDDIERSSMLVITTDVPLLDPITGKLLRFVRKYKRQGPDNKQFAALKETVSTCAKLHQVCDELGGTIGSTGKEFDAVKAQSEKVGTKAQRLVENDWRQLWDTDPDRMPTK